MLPVLAAILSSLAGEGLTTLVGAVKAKGTQYVEDKLGIKLPTSTSQLTPELVVQLKEREMEHEEALIKMQTERASMELEAEGRASEEVTKRWQADMASDSYLAKNIRPLTLLFILAVYTIFGLLSAFGIVVIQAYVELLGQWGMIIMSAYFVGRTYEKVITTKQGE